MDASQRKHLKDRISRLSNEYMYGENGPQAPPDPDFVKRLKKQHDMLADQLQRWQKPIDKRMQVRRDRVREIISEAHEKVLFLSADEALAAVNALEAKLKKAVR